ncbi:MAG TPA: LPS export ABC transporter periplasmic protein LptC [Gemmatimonadales bacterium]|jgi:LPS export ABC transporter protein LptC|nr:LPS export ABC transporter periplasmic protein LptC [Gemmatimonadales bacterium]
MRGVALLLAALLVAACSGDSTTPTGAFAEADSADMRMLGFDYNVSRNGIRRSRLEADTAYFYDAHQTSVLRHVRATFFNDAGASRATLTADRMNYNLRDGSMRAEGNVVLVGPAGERLTTSVLVFDVNRNTLSSDKHFVLQRPGERLEGSGFDADADFSRFQGGRLVGVTADTSLSR